MWVFISYSHIDSRFAQTLKKALARFSISAWLDVHEPDLGLSLVARLGVAVADAEFVIPIISHEAVGSRWVGYEIELALRREKAENKKILLPVLHRGGLLPGTLADRTFIDFRTSALQEDGFPKLLENLRVSATKMAELAVVPVETPQLVTADGAGKVFFPKDWPLVTPEPIPIGQSVRRDETLYWLESEEPVAVAQERKQADARDATRQSLADHVESASELVRTVLVERSRMRPTSTVDSPCSSRNRSTSR